MAATFVMFAELELKGKNSRDEYINPTEVLF